MASTLKFHPVSRKPTPPLLFLLTTLGFIFGCIASFLLIQLKDLKYKLLLAEISSSTPARKFSSNHTQAITPELDDTLAEQGLSHAAFHQKPFKRRLAFLVQSTGVVAIVGVEWGAEAMMLVNEGYSVHAFEPFSWHYNRLEKLVNESRAQGTFLHQRLTVYNIAAEDHEGTFHLKYKDLEKEVPMQPIRKYIHKEINLLSVDVQGAEPGVLRGAKGIPIRSMWIEVNCRTLEQIFNFLGNDYVIFDFVPWGVPKYNASIYVSLTTYPEWVDRPSTYVDYKKWFCDVRNKFLWLITDFIAIRRDVLIPHFINAMSTLSHELIVALAEK